MLIFDIRLLNPMKSSIALSYFIFKIVQGYVPQDRTYQVRGVYSSIGGVFCTFLQRVGLRRIKAIGGGLGQKIMFGLCYSTFPPGSARFDFVKKFQVLYEKIGAAR